MKTKRHLVADFDTFPSLKYKLQDVIEQTFFAVQRLDSVAKQQKTHHEDTNGGILFSPFFDFGIHSCRELGAVDWAGAQSSSVCSPKHKQI